MGFRHPSEPWMAACVALLVTAVDEPFGRTLIEAMLLETPVIAANRSEEHTSELQSLMRSSYAVFCLKKKKLQLSKYFISEYHTRFSILAIGSQPRKNNK